ncbi:MAG TPA: hypothetical protein VGA29_05670, partial [Ignavibacteriaceae bacterium]
MNVFLNRCTIHSAIILNIITISYYFDNKKYIWRNSITVAPKKYELGETKVSKKESEKPAIEKKAVVAAYEVAAQPLGSIAALPDQEVPETEKTPEWYVTNVQYICSFYNVPYQNVLAPVGYDEAGVMSAVSPVSQMIRYMQYYLGKQPNLDYNHLTENVTENNLQASWIKGQDISELIKFMKGNILDRINNIEISARPMSEDATSEREDMLKKLTMKHELKEVFEQMKGAGLDYAPANGKEFENQDDIRKWVDEGGFKDVGAEYATDIANNFWFSNFCASKFIQAFNHATIAGVAAMEHYVDNGKNYMKVRMPYQLILDTRVDDDYNREAMFIGSIDCMTPIQLFSKYRTQFSKEQKEEIFEMCRNQELGDKYNSVTNFTWWNYSTQRQANTVSVVNVYWYGRHDLGLKKKENK